MWEISLTPKATVHRGVHKWTRYRNAIGYSRPFLIVIETLRFSHSNYLL